MRQGCSASSFGSGEGRAPDAKARAAAEGAELPVAGEPIDVYVVAAPATTAPLRFDLLAFAENFRREASVTLTGGRDTMRRRTSLLVRKSSLNTSPSRANARPASAGPGLRLWLGS